MFSIIDFNHELPCKKLFLFQVVGEIINVFMCKTPDKKLWQTKLLSVDWIDVL